MVHDQPLKRSTEPAIPTSGDLKGGHVDHHATNQIDDYWTPLK